MMAEKFSLPELTELRSEMLESGFSSQDAAEVLQLFVTGRGYGISPEVAKDVMGRLQAGWPLESIQQELDRVALVN
ncbi:MAG TPA: hypothetical protein VF135_13835 [Terriglobales bacterium]